MINQVNYQTNDKDLIQVKYYELEDKSISFIKIIIPEVGELTLPRVLSASGEKYTDNAAFIWWTKGDEGTLYRINNSGGWDKFYANCRTIIN